MTEYCQLLSYVRVDLESTIDINGSLKGCHYKLEEVVEICQKVHMEILFISAINRPLHFKDIYIDCKNNKMFYQNQL